ncbi:MAG: DUF2459 domain-containing protein [Gammaproteobacteria bacterium]|nr:DUF2459 domain-containing protein [Gammaproteobacteria bacterium]
MACSACAGSGEKTLCLPGPNGPTVTVYLVSHGWHAGIVVKRADISNAVWPEQLDFPMSKFLEVGWGDRDYYQTPAPGWGVTLKAALLPTESVLHIVSFDDAVLAYFPRSEVIEIQLSKPGFERLSRYISASYSKDVSGKSIPLGPGLYGVSQMYLSTETYHLFNTCNVWSARAIKQAGCPITPAVTVTVESLMSRARGFGRLIQSVSTTPDFRAE